MLKMQMQLEFNFGPIFSMTVVPFFFVVSCDIVSFFKSNFLKDICHNLSFKHKNTSLMPVINFHKMVLELQ